ncbi:MAG: hypothetical protein JSV04_03140, partial [Candidatus Heimdallarchaeota archaeon]
EENMTVGETTSPLRLVGDIQADIIIVVGGNLPYFTEESGFLLQLIEEQQKNVILFEDNGYARVLTSAFGITLGGTVIDQDFHARNPYQPVINQSRINIEDFSFSSCTLVFNKGVRVEKTRDISETDYYPLFRTEGKTWEDKNHDGKFYRTNESIGEELCYLGGILSFDRGGNFIVIGDSALPTNDMIDRQENRAWLSELISFLLSTGAESVLFDESRKLWIPPTGKAIISVTSVLLMGAFHSPLIAIITLIILGGIISVKKEDHLSDTIKIIRKSIHPVKEIKPIAAFLQSEEEEEFARVSKTSITSDLYRALLADEIQRLTTTTKLTPTEKIEYENYLRLRNIDQTMYNKLVKKLKNHEKENGEEIYGSR